MAIEKEYRYKISEKNIDLIRNNSVLTKSGQNMTDIVMGYYGFESLSKLGYICRIRQKKSKTIMECKKLREDGAWLEKVINLESVGQGYAFLSNMGLKPYLLIERTREERETPYFKIAIDNVSLLGQFVEIELKNPDISAEIEIQDFLDKCNIQNVPQKLYGDIFKENCENNENFDQMFKNRLLEIINTIN